MLMRLLSRKKLGANTANRPSTSKKTITDAISLASTLRRKVGESPPRPLSAALGNGTALGRLLKRPFIRSSVEVRIIRLSVEAAQPATGGETDLEAGDVQRGSHHATFECTTSSQETI
jgi:hypothetical protein